MFIYYFSAGILFFWSLFFPVCIAIPALGLQQNEPIEPIEPIHPNNDYCVLQTAFHVQPRGSQEFA